MDCSLPGSSVRAIFQARVLEWGAIAFSISWYNEVLIFVPSLLVGGTKQKSHNFGDAPYSKNTHWLIESFCEESWAPKNWCVWTVVLEKTLGSPLDCKEIQPLHSRDDPWVFFGRNDAEAETPGLWPLHAKSWLTGKDSDAGRDWGQEEEGTTEDEMAGWHHGLDGRESEWTPGVDDGQGGLACCDSWGCKESDTAEQLNWC